MKLHFTFSIAQSREGRVPYGGGAHGIGNGASFLDRNMLSLSLKLSNRVLDQEDISFMLSVHRGPVKL